MKKVLCLLLYFITLKAYAGSESVFIMDQQSFVVTTTSTKALDQNAVLNYLLIQNKGTDSIYVKFGSAQTNPGEGVLIPAGGNYEPIHALANSIWLESASGSQPVMIVTGQ